MNKVLCFDKYFTNIFIDISKSPFILLTFFYGSVIINKRCFKEKIKIRFRVAAMCKELWHGGGKGAGLICIFCKARRNR